MRFYSETKITLADDTDIHLHYANNKGRGSDNVTVTVVHRDCPRPARTAGYRDYEDMIRVQFQTSGWRGAVNIPTQLINDYGGVVEDLRGDDDV